MSMSKTARLLGSLLLALVAAIPGFGAEERRHPYVIVIGIGEYADSQIKPCSHAEEDARAIYDLAIDPDYMDTDSGHVRLLLGKPDEQRKSEPATRDNILKALRWAVSRAGTNDLVLLAWIGNGAPLGEKACYFASDSTFKDRAKDAVPAADIEQELEKLKSQRFCVFMDVNFKGFDTGKQPAPDMNLTHIYKEFLGKEENNSNIGRVVFLAGRGLTPSLASDGKGLFARIVVEGLKGTADKDGYEPDGLVTVDELNAFLEKEYPARARKVGKTREEKETLPIVLPGQSSHYSLCRNPTVMPTIKARLEKLDKLAQGKSLTPDLIEEGNDLLGRMPKLEARQTLRKNYQQLVDGKLALSDFLKERERIFDGMKIKRVAAVGFATKVIEAGQQVQESYVKEQNQGELVGWAIRGLYQSADEKLPQDIKDRLEGVKSMSENDLTTLLADAREKLGKREDLDKHKDINIALQRMLSHLDPYTTYIDPEATAQFDRDVRKNYSGIGIQIRKHADNDKLLVVTPIKGSPAYKAGLKAGDIISTITRDVDSDGKVLDKPEVIPTLGLPLADAVKKVLGKPDTKVKLTIEREGVDKPFDLEITRATIELETIFGVKRLSDDSWDHLIDPENQIGYVRLSSFAGTTTRDLGKALDALEKDGMKGLILDLRFNPGGLLDSAVAISDMFMDDGEIVSVRNRVGKPKRYRGRHAGSRLDFPMAVLINGGSASASEIVSACLQDHKRAVVVGERSFGKGSVQNIHPFDGGKLKMTIASFWRPSEKNLNKAKDAKDDEEWGVMPDKDYLLKLDRQEREELAEHMHKIEIIQHKDVKSTDVKTEFKDRQLDVAIEQLRGRIRTALSK